MGLTRGSRFRLVVKENKFLLRPPLEFAPGVEGLVLRLETGGSLHADVLVDAAVREESFRLELVPESGPALVATPDLDHVFMHVSNWLVARRRPAGGEGPGYRWPVLWPGS
jgi:hypothetical protein